MKVIDRLINFLTLAFAVALLILGVVIFESITSLEVCCATEIQRVEVVVTEECVCPTSVPCESPTPGVTVTTTPTTVFSPTPTDVQPTPTPSITATPPVEPTPTERGACNRGIGNGREDCDPGNSGGQGRGSGRDAGEDRHESKEEHRRQVEERRGH